MSRLRAQRRGFTLLEVVIYCGLVTVGLATFIAVEVSARRNTALQGAILDVEGEARRFLDAWRQDVEAAQSVTIQRGAQGASDGLEVVRLDGTKVRFSLGKRVELDAKGAQVGEDRYAHHTALRFKLTKRELEASLDARRSLGDKALTRAYRRVATPRVASATLKAVK